MKKRFLGILLALVLVLSLLPATVFAADTTETVNTAAELESAVAAGGTVKLGKDIDISSTLDIYRTAGLVIIDLNGHTLRMIGNSGVIYVGTNANLTLMDSSEEQTCTISNCTATYNGGGVYNYEEALFKMEGGTISGCSANNGGCVYNEDTLQNNSNTGATICYGELVNNGSIEGKLVEFYNGDDLYAWEVIPSGGKVVKPKDIANIRGMMTE